MTTAGSRLSRGRVHTWKRASRVFAALCAFASSSLLALGTPASAQQAGGAPAPGAVPGGVSGLNIDLQTLLKAKPGAWADYTMSGKAGEKPVTIRYALVERTAAKLALEVDSATPRGEMVIHFNFAPQGADTWKLTGGKIQLGDQKIEIPATQLAAAAPLKTSDLPGDLVGTEDLTTPLGAFQCKHYKKSMAEGGKGPNLDVWMNEKVSPTGLVKSTLDSMGVQMTLLATGTGAQAKLP
jgi:hypothetical protein